MVTVEACSKAERERSVLNTRKSRRSEPRRSKERASGWKITEKKH